MSDCAECGQGPLHHRTTGLYRHPSDDAARICRNCWRRRMSRVVITGYSDGKKIQAIKGIRGATGLGLKEAKDVADAVDMGRSVEIAIPSHEISVLDQHGVLYQQPVPSVSLADFVNVLGEYPRGVRVGDLYNTLRAALDLEARRAAA